MANVKNSQRENNIEIQHRYNPQLISWTSSSWMKELSKNFGDLDREVASSLTDCDRSRTISRLTCTIVHFMTNLDLFAASLGIDIDSAMDEQNRLFLNVSDKTASTTGFVSYHTKDDAYRVILVGRDQFEPEKYSLYSNLQLWAAGRNVTLKWSTIQDSDVEIHRPWSLR